MNGDNVDHARVYYEAVGGRDRRGRVFGLGSYANVCYSHASSSSLAIRLVGLWQLPMRSLSYVVRSTY